MLLVKIVSAIKNDRAGLGLENKITVKLNSSNVLGKKSQTEKESIWEKTRLRYSEVFI